MSTPREKLENCVTRLLSGPWRFIQLRGEPLGIASIGGDDVDLLGSRESVASLARAAFDWARAGDCHFRMVARDRCKKRFILISTDGKHHVELDLWMELWQIDQRKRCLIYQNCETALTDPPSAIRRLPPILEACVYVHHLASKQKDLSGASTTARLSSYRNALPDFAVDLETILREKRINPDLLACFTAPLDTAFCLLEKRNGFVRWYDKIVDAWLGMPRRLSHVSVMGCDGAGKTTLARALVEDQEIFCGVFTGKHLYRKSWLYKLTVIFIRPLLFQSRETYDETMAPFVYLRACLGLRWKLLRPRKRILLIDRSLMDFLMVARKTDHPHFHWSAWLSRWCGLRIPVMHCVLPYEKVLERKNEMTRSGHDAYDTSMFFCHSARVPTDYIVFNNSGTLEECAAAADLVVRWMVEESR